MKFSKLDHRNPKKHSFKFNFIIREVSSANGDEHFQVNRQQTNTRWPSLTRRKVIEKLAEGISEINTSIIDSCRVLLGQKQLQLSLQQPSPEVLAGLEPFCKRISFVPDSSRLHTSAQTLNSASLILRCVWMYVPPVCLQQGLKEGLN